MNPFRIELIIRQATSADIRDIIAISRRVQDELTELGSLQQVGPLEWSALSSHIEKQETYVAVNPSNEIVGTATVHHIEADFLPQTREFDIARFPDPWRYLKWLMLDPSMQRHGYGFQLFGDVTDMVERAGGLGSMFLDCWAGNDKLREFYERCGLLYMGTVPEEDFHVAVYVRFLGPPPDMRRRQEAEARERERALAQVQGQTNGDGG